MTKKINRVIIEIVDDRGNFLPLSDQVPKELFKLGEVSVLEILIEEAVSVGAEDIVFLTEKKDERLSDLLKNLGEKEERLKRKGNPRSRKLKEIKNKFGDLNFYFEKDFSKATQKPGDFAYISSDTICVENGLSQLMKVFKTSERPVLGLKPADLGEVKTEKIARGLFKLRGFSDEASYSMTGRGIFTSESRKFFEEAETVRGAIENMMDRGHTTYGTEIDGKVFPLKTETDYLKANIFYSLKNEEVKEFTKEIL